MAFKRALWVGGFPEREDAVGSGTISNNNQTTVRLPNDRPLMVEIVVTRPTWVARAAAAPPNDASSFYLVQNTPMRLEVGTGENLYLRRVSGSQSITYSTRTWIRE